MMPCCPSYLKVLNWRDWLMPRNWPPLWNLLYSISFLLAELELWQISGKSVCSRYFFTVTLFNISLSLLVHFRCFQVSCNFGKLQVYSYLLFSTKTKLDDSFPYFHFHVDNFCVWIVTYLVRVYVCT